MTPDDLKQAQWAIYLLDGLCVLAMLDLLRNVYRAVKQARTIRKWGKEK